MGVKAVLIVSLPVILLVACNAFTTHASKLYVSLSVDNLHLAEQQLQQTLIDMDAYVVDQTQVDSTNVFYLVSCRQTRVSDLLNQITAIGDVIGKSVNPSDSVYKTTSQHIYSHWQTDERLLPRRLNLFSRFDVIIKFQKEKFPLPEQEVN